MLYISVELQRFLTIYSNHRLVVETLLLNVTWATSLFPTQIGRTHSPMISPKGVGAKASIQNSGMACHALSPKGTKSVENRSLKGPVFQQAAVLINRDVSEERKVSVD